MIFRPQTAVKGLTLIVAAVLLSGLLAACGDDEPTTIDYVVDARISTYNANTVGGNADGVLMATTRLLPGFSLLGPQGQVIPDRDVGTVERLPGAELTLRYVFNADARFSDEMALDCDDLVLAWAAMSGRFAGFAPATTAGYRDIRSVDCAAADKVATVTFEPGRDYQDWPSLFGAGAMLPAHVVARDAGVVDVLDPIRARDRAVIARIARAWNTGFDLAPEVIDPARFPSSGPYRIDRYSRSGGLVLVPNEMWWADAPQTPRIVVWGRNTDSVRRLPEGRYDIVDVTGGMIEDRPEDGSDSEDTVRLTVSPARALAVESLVLAGQGVFNDRRVRQAFAACVPREALARDFGGGARMWNLRVLAPADNLAGGVNNEFGRAYARPDPARARRLLEQADPDGPAQVRVRIGYLAPTLRWERMVAAIADSCRGAGLEVVDAASAETNVNTLGEDLDALIVADGASFAAAGAASPIRSAYSLRAGDPLNLSGYRNPQVTRAVDELAVTSSTVDALRLVRAIENSAWAAVPTIPLFAAPRVRQWNDRVDNVVGGLGRNGTGWNMDRWTVNE